jgi:hypothetical protein
MAGVANGELISVIQTAGTGQATPVGFGDILFVIIIGDAMWCVYPETPNVMCHSST